MLITTTVTGCCLGGFYKVIQSFPSISATFPTHLTRYSFKQYRATNPELKALGQEFSFTTLLKDFCQICYRGDLSP